MKISREYPTIYPSFLPVYFYIGENKRTYLRSMSSMKELGCVPTEGVWNRKRVSNSNEESKSLGYRVSFEIKEFSTHNFEIS